MASKGSKKKVQESTSGSDSGSDEPTPAPVVKKQKVEVSKKEVSKKKGSGASGDDADNKFPLSNNKFVTVRSFNSKCLIDIREFYTSGGDLKPGKKGISLNPEQWNALKDHISEIDEAVKKF